MSTNRPPVPENVRESLAMIWVKEHAKDAKTPSDLLKMYRDTLSEIRVAYQEQNKNEQNKN